MNFWKIFFRVLLLFSNAGLLIEKCFRRKKKVNSFLGENILCSDLFHADTKSLSGGIELPPKMESEDIKNGNTNENKPPVNFILGGENEPEIHIEEDESGEYCVGGMYRSKKKSSILPF